MERRREWTTKMPSGLTRLAHPILSGGPSLTSRVLRALCDKRCELGTKLLGRLWKESLTQLYSVASCQASWEGRKSSAQLGVGHQTQDGLFLPADLRD